MFEAAGEPHKAIADAKLGALLGTAAVVAGTRPQRWALLAVTVGLTLVSERVSFTEVIARTPVLREIDAWGRR